MIRQDLHFDKMKFFKYRYMRKYTNLRRTTKFMSKTSGFFSFLQINVTLDDRKPR